MARRISGVRLGVIGVGNMGSWHARSLQAGKVARCRLAAVCDTNPAALAPYSAIPRFADSGKLVRSGEVDAVIIATPHFLHVPIALDAVKRGIHVLTEKPVAVTRADVLRLGAARRKARKVVVAAMFQMRTSELYRKIKWILEHKELGTLRRIQWTVTDWFRTNAYYASGGWRATWKGEGGGLLVNQCVHNLDIWQWLFGMPDLVRAWCGFGRYHPIEVEDDVTAYFSYRGGLTGTFITSSGEAPGVNRLEITGDRGTLLYANDRLTMRRNETPAAEFCRTSPRAYEAPDTWFARIPVRPGHGDHAIIVRNFVDAIIDGKRLIAPAEEGANQAELSNAITLSALENRDVSLPMPPARYEKVLRGLMRKSRKRLRPVSRDKREVPRYIVR